jgi:hypothetical protein
MQILSLFKQYKHFSSYLQDANNLYLYTTDSRCCFNSVLGPILFRPVQIQLTVIDSYSDSKTFKEIISISNLDIKLWLKLFKFRKNPS